MWPSEEKSALTHFGVRHTNLSHGQRLTPVVRDDMEVHPILVAQSLEKATKPAPHLDRCEQGPCTGARWSVHSPPQTGAHIRRPMPTISTHIPPLTATDETGHGVEVGAGLGQPLVHLLADHLGGQEVEPDKASSA